MKFELLACTMTLRARRVMEFPPYLAGNVLRGTFGTLLREVASPEQYAQVFEPASINGPSGLRNRPRPFVFRSAALNGRTVQSGEQFCFGVNLFHTREPMLDLWTAAFSRWADVVSFDSAPVSIDLTPRSESVSRVRVEFETPTDLKGSLLARARDRVATLQSLYGKAPLTVDFHYLNERAQSIAITRRDLRRIRAIRRSSRTGQSHDVGGLIGSIEYEGDLAPFLPYLEAAQWTGVGRHCAWGNGQISIHT